MAVKLGHRNCAPMKIYAAPAATYTWESHAKGRAQVRLVGDEWGATLEMRTPQGVVTGHLSPDQLRHFADGCAAAAADYDAMRLDGNRVVGL